MKTLFPARPRVARNVRLVAVAATLVLAASACGGDEKPSASPSASAPTAAPVETRACPITTTPVPASPGISADLTVKPVVPAHTAPAPAGITVADIKVGDGATVVVGTPMKLKYVGALYDTGVEFDSSWKTSPETTLDLNGTLPRACFEGVVKGFSVGPLGMKVGGRREITFPAAYGYGAEGSPPSIPANAALTFVVDLVDIG